MSAAPHGAPMASQDLQTNQKQSLISSKQNNVFPSEKFFGYMCFEEICIGSHSGGYEESYLLAYNTL
jgi:hypothetical protein